MPGAFHRQCSLILETCPEGEYYWLRFQIKTLQFREVKGAAQRHTELGYKTGLFDFKVYALLNISGSAKQRFSCSIPMTLGTGIMRYIALDLPIQQKSHLLSTEKALSARLSTSFH